MSSEYSRFDVILKARDVQYMSWVFLFMVPEL